MNTHHDLNHQPQGPRTESVLTVGSLGSAGNLSSRNTGALRAWFTAMLLLLAVTSGGCATRNYDFDAMSGVDGSARAIRLTKDLALEIAEGDHEELYDVKMIPLAHTHLNVFSESTDQGIEEGYVEADIDAYLPLFSIINAKITRYDGDRRLAEHHEFHSFLWGLYSSHLERVDTRLGMRETKERRFLWFFGWDSTPEYTPSKHAFHAKDYRLPWEKEDRMSPIPVSDM